MRAAREDAAGREGQLRCELDRAQAAVREQVEKAARARRMHDRCGRAAECAEPV